MPPNKFDDDNTVDDIAHDPSVPEVWHAPQTPKVVGWRLPALPKELDESPEETGDWHLPKAEDKVFNPEDETDIVRSEDELPSQIPKEDKSIASEGALPVPTPEDILSIARSAQNELFDQSSSSFEGIKAPEEWLSLLEKVTQEENPADMTSDFIALQNLQDESNEVGMKLGDRTKDEMLDGRGEDSLTAGINASINKLYHFIDHQRQATLSALKSIENSPTVDAQSGLDSNILSEINRDYDNPVINTLRRRLKKLNKVYFQEIVKYGLLGQHNISTSNDEQLFQCQYISIATKLDPSSLQVHISTFLKAAFALQETINGALSRIQKNPPRILALVSGSTNIQLADFAEGFRAIDEILTPTQRKNRKELNEQHIEQAKIATQQQHLQTKENQINTKTLENYSNIVNDPDILEAEKQLQLTLLETKRQEAMLDIIHQRAEIAEKLHAIKAKHASLAMQLTKETIELFGIEKTTDIVDEFVTRYTALLEIPIFPKAHWESDDTS